MVPFDIAVVCVRERQHLGEAIVNELGDDIQVQLMVQAVSVKLQAEWPQISADLQIQRFERPGMWGPTMAAKLAQPFIAPPNRSAQCHKGTVAHEAVLVQVAGTLHWGRLTHDPFGGLSKFYGHALSNLDRRLGYADVPALMGASAPYVADLAAGDMYRVALRASKVMDSRLDGVPSIVLNAWTAFHMWPIFFSNLTLKKALI